MQQTPHGSKWPEEAAVNAVAAQLCGPLVRRGDRGYGAVRRVYNAMIDLYPNAVVRCVDLADVRAAVRFADREQVTVAIRGGGHGIGGLGTCEDGLVIDLSLMKGIHVDPMARTVRVGGGCTWGEVDHTTHAFGLVTPSGTVSTTGVGGLTLGGGIGHLTRRYGLTIDNLLAVEIVLADGQVMTASAESHPDLFWAVRGGGGNFGVVTSFLFRLHPLSTVVGGPMLWPLERASELLRRHRDFIVQARNDISGFFTFLKVPPGPPFPAELSSRTMCGIVWCYTGPQEQAERIFAPIRRFAGGPTLDLVEPLPYPALQSMFDALYPPGLYHYWRADFVKKLSEKAIAQHVRYGATLPTQLSTVHLYPINGAAHRVKMQDTAFSYRDADWAEVIIGADPYPVNAPRIKEWTISYWEALHQYSAGGAGVNFMMAEGEERLRAAYRDNFKRLAEVKRRYDPTNLFRVNQNIPPSA
jgi:FAD/FMN-containing dehydrogenase